MAIRKSHGRFKSVLDFPLHTIQSGAPVGNGRLGLLVWGERRNLRITMGLADLWDHRDGLCWNDGINLGNVSGLVADGDWDGMLHLFHPPYLKFRPSLIPLGRVELTLPEGYFLVRCSLDMSSGILDIEFDNNGYRLKMELAVDMSGVPRFVIRGVPEPAEARILPAWDLFDGTDYVAKGVCLQRNLAERGFAEPTRATAGDVSSFLQPLPNDPAVAAALRRSAGTLSCVVWRSETAGQGPDIAFPDPKELFPSCRSWWSAQASALPEMVFADPLLEEIYRTGMHSFIIATNPRGVPPGLQGAWIEDDRLAPWSGDYHFNVNVQMCLAPGLAAGLFEHVRPIFELLKSWLPRMRDNARSFLGIDDGYMLPHSVDDRCTCIGDTWCIDSACTAWMAVLAYDYCDLSGDRYFLESFAFDFMRGAMRVFEMLMERTPRGLSFPLSMSPEYRGNNHVWFGRDASFYLAAAHRLARDLIAAAGWLGEEPDPFWAEVEKHLPQASVSNGAIDLFDGRPLDESHRHHSHLAAIAPFATIDPESPGWREIVSGSMRHWEELGMGQWSGWSMPWAAQLYVRTAQPAKALEMLRIWRRNFCNRSGASLHNGLDPEFSVFNSAQTGEVMQLDALMQSVATIQEMYMFSRDGEMRLFNGLCDSSRPQSFRNMRASGGFVVSGEFIGGRTSWIEITATRNATPVVSTRDCRTKFSACMSSGETLRLQPDGKGGLSRAD
ncbi:MAG: hypothetical protein MJ025_05685 [Victivallaceae bacterium]|nr:hypothetical protein [Victivallaceae bacterium]